MTLSADRAVDDAASVLFTAPSDADRRAALASLAGVGPMVRIPLPGGELGWLVTDQAEVRRLLTHPHVRKQRDLFGGPFVQDLPADVADGLFRHMLNTNPPDHGRLRRLVAAAFTRRRVDAMAPRIQQLTDGLLDAAAVAQGPIDLIEALAAPLPVRVIGDLLGVPEADFPRFRAWTRPLVTGVLAGRDAYVEAAVGMLELLRELVARCRATPGDDLLSALVRARDAGDRLDEDELTSAGFLLLAAGHETTVNLIGNGVHALLTHPDQLALLQRPDLLPVAIEELLRHDGPVHVTLPYVTDAPVQVGDVTIAAGAIVLPGLTAAGRDPGRFTDPERLDLTRPDAGHVAFGHGIHHCLGAPLARLEGRIAIGTLLARFPDLCLAPSATLVRTPGLLMNGFAALPVLLGVRREPIVST